MSLILGIPVKYVVVILNDSHCVLAKTTESHSKIPLYERKILSCIHELRTRPLLLLVLLFFLQLGGENEYGFDPT